jgi:hypothetical protein
MTDLKTLETGGLNNAWRQALVKRAEGLLAAPDLVAEVARLEPLEAYYIVRDVGLGQALPILRALSSEQLMTCVDLDCWSHYDFGADQLDEWLTAFSLAGPESLAEAFFSLDYVMQLLFLAQTVIVYDPDTDEVPPQDDNEEPIRAMTPDGFYLLELKTKLKLTVHPFTVLDSLYQYDLQATHQLLSEVRVDPAMQIEEEALRFRNGRMEDLGFATPDEAATLFSSPRKAAPSVKRSAKKKAATGVPALYSKESGHGLFHQALAGLADDVLPRVEQELVWTINTAMIAYGEKTRDSSQVVAVAKRVRDTISLGLETIVAEQFTAESCAEYGGLATDVLAVVPVTEVFKHGVAASLVLQNQVKVALKNLQFKQWFELDTADQSEDSGDLLDRAFVQAILGNHPLWSGFEFSKPDAVKGFGCRADIHKAMQRLDDLLAHICPE